MVTREAETKPLKDIFGEIMDKKGQNGEVMIADSEGEEKVSEDGESDIDKKGLNQ